MRFGCTKHIHKNFEIYKDYFYENRDAPESLESYIGLPNLDDMLKAKSLYPFKTLEMGSLAYIKEKKDYQELLKQVKRNICGSCMTTKVCGTKN